MAFVKITSLTPRRRFAAFTLIELLVVMAIIATLLTLAVPRYFSSLEKSKEAVLRQDLASMRDSIDKYYADKGKYPETLEVLVEENYLKAVPKDPITESAETWITTSADDPEAGGVSDVHSGAPGQARDASNYGDW